MSTSMDGATFLERLENLQVWRKGRRRAPHKPLLLLQALARLERGEGRMMRFEEVEQPMKRLLREFGPTGARPNPQYPFWRLETDGIWEVFWPPPLRVRERRQKEYLAWHREEVFRAPGRDHPSAGRAK